MNRVITDEDRIRRAEIIAERRNIDFYDGSEKENVIKSGGRKKTLIIQILMCLCIYCGLYYVKNTKNESSTAIINNIKSSLQTDINFPEMYRFVRTKIESVLNKQKNNNVEDMKTNESAEIIGIGGEMEEVLEENTKIEEQVDPSALSDDEYIKEKVELIKPLDEYIITSPYGERPSSDIVSSNHKGIDLGAVSGTIIKSASDGVVTQASSYGDFGLHVIVKKDDIEFIYGHCSELLVSEGDEVCTGQEIAKVGATRQGYWTASSF